MSLELALKGLISEVLKEAGAIPAAAGAAPAAAQPRGRGRPPKGAEGAPVVPAAPDAQSTPPQTDPFAAALPATPPTPTATLEQVRDALTALRAATTQENALKVLSDAGKAGNITDLKPENYGAVVQAAKAAIPQAQPAPADPFAAPIAAATKLTLEDVRNVIVETQKRTGTDTVQKVVMEHGGKAANPETGAPAPSLKALPETQFEAVIKALKALPTTK